MTSPIDPHTLSNKTKLPIKRKTPDSTPTAAHGGDDDNPRPPPFKFHRIWTEPDEIRFLQGLLDCAADHLSFPRDLNLFYTRFSNTMSQPYTKSQLSEKLRRLRKKFRVISARLSKGLDPSLLSPHDRSLYHLSKQLWHPDFAMTSPFSTANSVDYNHRNVVNSGVDAGKSCLVGVKVSFSPNFPRFDYDNVVLNRENNENENANEQNGGEGLIGNYLGFDGVEVKLSEVNVELEEDSIDVGVGGVEEVMGEQNGVNVKVEEKEEEEDDEAMVENGGVSVNGLGKAAAKAVVNVFNEALEEVRMGIVGEGLKVNGRLEIGNNDGRFEKRWQEQRVAELDVFSRRLRLVLENSLPKQ